MRIPIALTAISVLLLARALSACGENQTHPERAAYDAAPPQALSCVPNLDGIIERSELGAAIGVPAHYLVSPSGQERAVNVAGNVDSQGHRFWDWSTDSADDQEATLTASLPAEKWYSASFPAADFVSPFDLGNTVEAIYKEDDDALYLLGLASTVPDPPEGKTLLVYDEPVALYRFPLESGKSWTSIGTSKNSTLRGLPYAGQDTYDVSIDASGEVLVPNLTFSQALRIRTNTTIAPTLGSGTTQRQVGFFFECYGEVARATSKLGETADDFGTAIEVRRLGFFDEVMAMKDFDGFKKGFDAWENATAQWFEKLLRSPLMLAPVSMLLTQAMKAKSSHDKLMSAYWSALGLPTKRDQERALFALHKLESKIMDLEERLAETGKGA